MSTALLHWYLQAAEGTFPPADGSVDLLPAPHGPVRAAVFATTGHHVVAANVAPAWLTQTLDATLAAAMAPSFILALERELGLSADSVDVVLAADGICGQSQLSEVATTDHRRVQRALRCRTQVRVFQANPALIVVLGRGSAGRLELALEVEPAAQGRGFARTALIEARKLAPDGEPLFAQVAPGNAAALRAFLASGFKPIGGEVLFYASSIGD